MERISTDTAAFEAMYRRSAPRVFAYALRHSDDATAQDVVSETFLTAWRRRNDLPDEPLPWLLVVARNTLANRHRSERHQERLVDAASLLGQVAAAGARSAVINSSIRWYFAGSRS